MTSNKSYLVKAYYEWISDNELTPYIMVDVSVYGVSVPMAFVNDGQIVLNVSGGAVGVISLGDDTIEFSARFGGKLEHIVVPYGAVGAVYAKENGVGTSMPIEHPIEQEEEIKAALTPRATLTSVDSNKQKPSSSAKPKGGATLKVIK